MDEGLLSDRMLMIWHYAYNPHIWPGVTGAGLMVVLAVYAWRRRSVPGALAFVGLAWFATPWLLATALEVAATEVSTRFFWAKFCLIWQLPAVTSSVCFALEYANLGRWLTRRTLCLLATPPVLFFLLIATNDLHHWMWTGISFAGNVHFQYALGIQITRAYGYALSLVPPTIFVWLFIYSPLHRWPAGLCILVQVLARIVFARGIRNWGQAWSAETAALFLALIAVTYALMLFRFRLFQLIPVARGTVIEQMREGMLILDRHHRIIDLNPSAAKIFGIAAASARGSDARQLLPFPIMPNGEAKRSGTEQAEVRLNGDGQSRDYLLHLSPLEKRRGFSLGSLILLHDFTDQKAAREQLLEQQRVVATLQERVRIARELHDGVAQVLAYMKIQAEVAQTYLGKGQPEEVELRLDRLVSAAQDALTDVREYILGSGETGNTAFLPALQRYVRRFGENSGIGTGLTVAPEIADGSFEPAVEAQLFRIIQEALTNVRKHAKAQQAMIDLHASDGCAEIVIQDNGAGFDPLALEHSGQQFGLRFMRERAEAVNGRVFLHSAPGDGTRIVIRVPWRKGQA